MRLADLHAIVVSLVGPRRASLDDILVSFAAPHVTLRRMSASASWQHFKQHYATYPAIGLSLDRSRLRFPAGFIHKTKASFERAFKEMAAIERGDRVNTTHGWMVGHYWLREAALAPTPDLREAITNTLERVRGFARRVHAGETQGAAGPFKNLLLIGIGGSALGPQFVAKALGHPRTDKLRPFFFDNTDPDGMDQVLAELEGQLGRTLCLVISKSGTTPETANGMLEAQAAYELAGLKFPAHAVAITMEHSRLHNLATDAQAPWLDVFPMWDWVGGRTSETSAVGLLPAALQGLDIDGLLAGAKACDEITRIAELKRNPAAQLALAWLYLTEGRGARDMVVLPYKDRLELFSRYLQQLVMESLGKEHNRAGDLVNQGITVYGNKGSTDQHAYVQQLRDGVANFFVIFLEVLRDRAESPSQVFVEPGITSGDYLSGLLQGTRQALYDNGRPSITITLDQISAHRIGALIALFERAVGLYAGLVNINAYDQPGVEAGKKAAAKVLDLQKRVVTYLAGFEAARLGQLATPEHIAAGVGGDADPETVFRICEHLAANPKRGVERAGGTTPEDVHYRKS